MRFRLPGIRWGAGRGTLLIISSFLIMSAIARLGSGSGAAIALELQNLRDWQDTDDIELSDISPELVALLEEAQARSEALDQREAEIEARMQALALIEASVNEDIERLEAAEADLRRTISDANSAAEDDIVRLTSVYENMKPEQAAALFQQMEPSFAAGFLGRMRADIAAAILAGLEPELAYTISVVLAGRNADVPRQDLPPETMEPVSE